MSYYDIHALKATYDLLDCPYFKIVNVATHAQVGSNATEGNKETAWNKFDQLYDALPSGIYQIYFKNTPTTGWSNANVYLLKKGEEEIIAMQQDGIARIGNVPGNLSSRERELIEKHNQEKLDLLEKFHKLEMKQLKQELRSEFESKQSSVAETAIAGIVNNIPSILDYLTGKTATVGLAGIAQPKSAPKNKIKTSAAFDDDDIDDIDDDDDDYNDDDDDSGNVPEFIEGRLDLNELVADANAIQEAMPEIHVNLLFNKLASWVQNNPAMARNLIANL